MASQDRYTDLVLQKLRATSVMYNLFNKSYEGTPTAGAVKIPVRDTEVTFGAYNKSTGIAGNLATTAFATLPIGKDMAVNEIIDLYDAASVPDGIVAERIDSAGYSKGIYIDSELIALCVEIGTGSVSLGNLTDEYKIMKKYATAAKKAHINPSDAWFVVSNDWMDALCDNTAFTHSTVSGDQVIANGRVAKVAGIAVYESDNMPTGVDFILGNSVYCHFVDEFAVPVHVQDLNGDGKHIGACAVQGRNVYGRGISRTETVFAKVDSSTYVTTNIANSVVMPD